MAIRRSVVAVIRPAVNFTSSLSFRVEDSDAARAQLADRGVPFDDEPHLIAEMPDHELWMTFFRDPDRNMHALMAEVPR